MTKTNLETEGDEDTVKLEGDGERLQHLKTFPAIENIRSQGFEFQFTGAP